MPTLKKSSAKKTDKPIAPEMPLASTQTAKKRKRPTLQQLKKLVFDNEKIRETILKHVIYDDAGEISTANACSCRLVKKSWFKTVSKLLVPSRESFFKICLNQYNSQNACWSVKRNGKVLERFIDSVTTSTSAPPENPIPPFKITATKDVFLKENHQSFSRCLSILGNHLVELDLEFPADGGSMTFIFPNFTLSKLNKLKICFCSENTDEFKRDKLPDVMVGNNYHVTYFIQIILAACSDVKELEIYRCGENNNIVPLGLECLVLPKSLNSIDFSCTCKSDQLKVLVKNELPNLKELTIVIPLEPLEAGLIFQVLKNVQNTVQLLHIRGITHPGKCNVPTYFEFPQMKVLNSLTITSINCELNPEVIDAVINLPALKELSLFDQTVNMLKMWTTGYKFESVKQFEIRLADERCDCLDNTINVNLECMQLLHSAFRNVCHLDLTLCDIEMKGLQYIFQEIKQLKVLILTLKKANTIENSDQWDALFIGIPLDLASALRTTSQIWNAIKINTQLLPSIKHLTELETLALYTEGSSKSLRNVSLISNAVFQFAFLKMAKLQNLVLAGRFMASPEMTEKWKSLNRQLIVENKEKDADDESSEESDEDLLHTSSSEEGDEDLVHTSSSE